MELFNSESNNSKQKKLQKILKKRLNYNLLNITLRFVYFTYFSFVIKL